MGSPANDAIDARIARLESLIDALRETTAAAPAPADGTTEAPPDVLDRIAAAADRLRRVTAEIAQRTGAAAWDDADRLSARLLLQELTAAVQGCRAVTRDAAARLARADAVLTETARVLDRAAAPARDRTASS